ncbi:Ankyrin repeat protein 1 [Giardia muris]|uniref:Ankyrin repeat protein 1 n=1 Tax=Giardia muris TaxID=5742 RepID=A0A4Z1T5L6_GIAMU|nr:Ankyrin repeat protein 1 [Giardia muris]|eukprot:TNJ27819.1 Ankyrin repeat protein 1 [Giardia muris]
MRSGRGRRWTDCTVWPHSCPPPHERGVEDSEGHGNGGLGTGGSSRRDRPTPLQGATDVLGVRNTTRGHRGPWDAALMMAASHGCPPSVLLLLPLEGGLFNNRKETALLLALQEGRVECARLLADEAAVHEEDGRMHGDPRACSGVARLTPIKDVSSSCRCPGGGGRAEGTGEAGDAQPAPRPGPPVPNRAVVRAVGSPGARRDGLVGTTSASPEYWTTPSVRTRWLTGASSASHARRTRSSFPAGTSSSVRYVRTGSSTAVRTAGGRPTRPLSSSILSGRMRSHTTPSLSIQMSWRSVVSPNPGTIGLSLGGQGMIPSLPHMGVPGEGLWFDREDPGLFGLLFKSLRA